MDRLRPVVAALAVVLLVACQEEQAQIGAGTFAPDLATRAETACLEKGGTWGRGGKAGFVCYERTRDAGQSCDSADDCEGLCLARSNSCSPITPLFGCHEVITSLGGRATLCID